MLNTRTLRFVLWAMSQPRIFYVLGAGASFGLVPMTPQLGSFLEREYHDIGIYPVSRASRSPLFERVVSDIPIDGRDSRKLLLWNIAPGTLDLLVQSGLWCSTDGLAPPQYAVFDVVGQRSTIFSFNLDGLASAYCGAKHYVLEPHGTIDRFWIEGPDYEQWLYATAAYDLLLPRVTPKLLPGPEPSGITETHAYSMARCLFTQCRVLFLIGYSFGRVKNTFDDAESFEYFVDLLRTYPRPTLIVSPSPDELVDLLQQRLRSGQVYGFPVHWELFSRIVLSAADANRHIPIFWSDKQLDVFVRAYHSAEERGGLTDATI